MTSCLGLSGICPRGSENAFKKHLQNVKGYSLTENPLKRWAGGRSIPNKFLLNIHQTRVLLADFPPVSAQAFLECLLQPAVTVTFQPPSSPVISDTWNTSRGPNGS